MKHPTPKAVASVRAIQAHHHGNVQSVTEEPGLTHEETNVPCRYVAGICMRRAELREDVRRTGEVARIVRSPEAERVAVSRYHRALVALAYHHCEPEGQQDGGPKPAA